EFGQPEEKKCYTYFHNRKEVCPWCKNEDVYTGKTIRWEWQSPKNQKTYDLIDTPLKNADGSVSKLEIFRDITERKKAEEVFKNKEEQFRTLIENIPGASYRCACDETWTMEYISDEIENISGYPATDFLDNSVRSYSSIIDPEDRKISDAIALEAIANKEKFIIEYRIITSDGSIRWIHERGQGIFDEEGKVVHLDGVILDITNRKKAEEELYHQTQLLSSIKQAQSHFITQDNPQPVFDMLLEILVLMTNSEYGFLDEVCLDESGQLFKKSLSLSNISWDNESRKLYEQLRTSNLEFRNLNNLASAPARSGKLIIANEPKNDPRSGGLPNGHPPVNSFMGIPMFFGGELVGVAGVANREGGYCEEIASSFEVFISTCASIIHAVRKDRKLSSLASQLSLTEERERRRIATELHDQIGQSLVFSKIKLDELHQSATSIELTKALDEICSNIGQIIQDTRSLTFDLSSPILNEIGLEAAVAEWLDVQIQAKHGIETEFVDDGQQKPIDDDIRALLFRNVRELLVNVIKHAKAHKVKVSIRRVNEHIRIDVEDDGKGFDSVKVASRATEETKFGLFSIRQRLEHLGGSFEIDSEPGRGSKFAMTVPVKQM
ncbi:MAG: GAF domain-containing sensor histidine kinase, partial [Planctomycetota bacterium]